MKKEIVLITGGTGFIGFHLTKYLIAKGHDLRLLVRKHSTNLKKLEELRVEVVHGDITELDSILPAFKDVRIVIHCAGYVSDWGKKAAYNDINVLGTENVLKASVEYGVQRFISISTNDVFGRIEDRVVDESFPLKEWREPYPDTKIAAEKLLWHYHEEYDLPVTTCYPCWVYGPDDTTFLPHLIEAIADNSFLYWRKEAHFYPTYVENLLDLLYKLVYDDSAIGNGYLVHDGDKVLLEDFCNRISDQLDLKRVKIKVPYFLAYGFAKTLEWMWTLLRLKSRPLLTTYVVKNFGGKINYSQKKAADELAWTPPFTFEEGFYRTMKWFKESNVHTIK